MTSFGLIKLLLILSLSDDEWCIEFILELSHDTLQEI
jgi:hypothetical protein